MNDLRLALRQLAKTPGFTIVAILSLAIGIGANTAIFTLVNDFLLRSLPVKHPDELVLFRAIHGARGRMSRRGEGPGSTDPVTGRNSGTPLSILMLERFLAARPSPLADVFAYSPFSQVNVVVDGVPETTVSAQYVSGDYYAGLGVTPALGRVLTSDDDRAGAEPAAVISYRFWTNRFSRDPSVLGRVIAINKVPTSIVGVAPYGFEGAMQAGETAEVSVALALHLRFQPDRPTRVEPSYWWIRIMGRLAPGVTAASAAAALEPMLQTTAREGWIASQSRQPSETPMPDDPLLALDRGAQGENDVRRQFAGSLYILMGLGGLVLLAACANVANLLVARGQTRRREIAVRLALGARRRIIIQQLLIESSVLAVGGGILGVALASWGSNLLLALRPFGNTTVTLDLPLDGRVLAFTLAASALTTIIFGLAPSLRAANVDLRSQFQGGTRTISGGGRSRLSQTFMVVQVALSLVLLVCAGLFARTLDRLQRIDPGFNATSLVLFRIDGASAGYTPQAAMTMQERIKTRVEAIPGVQAVTFSRVALLSRTRQNMTFAVEGGGLPTDGIPAVNTNGLAVNFFSVMNLPIVLGRPFTDADVGTAPRVAIVNQAFVGKFLGEGNPIGRQLKFSAPNFTRTTEIVGVARDAKYTDLRSPAPPTVYFAARQQLSGDASFAVRTAVDSAATFAAIRAAVRDVDPTLPVLNLRTQAEQVDRLNGQERLFARLSGFFGVTALLLACVGLYGLMSHVVLRRAPEIGLRLALGAVPAHVIRMIVRESLVLVGLGIVLGAIVAYSSGRLIATLMFEISPSDPVTYAVVAVLLLLTGSAAALVPAHRASRIEPLIALRLE